MMKKWIALFLAAVLCLSMAACARTDPPQGGSTGGNDQPGNQQTQGSQQPGEQQPAPSENEEVPEGVVEVTWWTNYGASNVAYIQTLIDKFNESQDRYHVSIERQGSDNELKAKLRSTKKENLPTMFSGTPATTSFYVNSGFTACFQDFLDADTEDWTANLYGVIRTSYSDTEGRMWGFPFGVSSTGLWVNEDAIGKAGYKVSDLTSFVKAVEIAGAAVRGGYTTYSIGFHKTGAYLNGMLALEGVNSVDADNGYSGDPTKCLYDEGDTFASLTEAMTAYAAMYQAGEGVPYGTDANGEILPNFASGKIAMFYGTNSYAGKLLSYNSNLNYTFIPTIPLTEHGKNSGVIPSGTGNYISSSASKAAQQGAYELIKFLAKVENQVYWCEQTGYVPYTSDCMDDQGYKDWSAANFPAALDLLDGMLNTGSELRLPYVSVDTDIQSTNVKLMENIYADPYGDVQEYIRQAAESINEALEIAALSR